MRKLQIRLKLLDKVGARLDVHTMDVIRKSSASLIVKMLAMAAGFGVSITLGRELGPEGLGVINLANKWVGIILVLAMFGMDKVILKEVAIGVSRKNLGYVSKVVNTALRFNVIVGVVLIILMLLLIPILITYVFNEPELKIPLIIAVLAMLPQIISRVYGAGLIGHNKIWQSNLVNETLSIWIVGILLLVYISIGATVSVIEVAWFYAIGRVIVSLTVCGYWRRVNTLRAGVGKNLSVMLKIAFPLLLVNATGIISSSADMVMLGWLADVKEVGFYSVAARLALITSFILQVSNSAISPKLASLYANNKRIELAIMVRRVILGLTLTGLASLVVFVLAGKLILSLWGADFQNSYPILVILAIGQFVNISTGPMGYLLSMCGQERIYGKIAFFSLVSNLVLNYFLISNYGAVGAAVATSAIVIIENVIKLIIVRKRIKI